MEFTKSTNFQWSTKFSFEKLDNLSQKKTGFYISAQGVNYISLRNNYIFVQKLHNYAKKLHICTEIVYVNI